MKIELIIQLKDVQCPSPIAGKFMFFQYAGPWVYLPKNCRECGKILANESTVVYLKSGGYCEKCYNYWYAYKNKRFTEDQALCRSLGMWPYGFRPNTGMIDFKMPSKKSVKYGKIWNRHPSDWPTQTRKFLKADQILIDGVNFP